MYIRTDARHPRAMAATSASSASFSVPGDYLDKCGRCGLSLRTVHVVAPVARAAQPVVLATDARSAQFYHAGCFTDEWATTGADASSRPPATTAAVAAPTPATDVCIVTRDLPNADAVLNRCGDEACKRTLPKEAPAEAAADRTRSLSGPRGYAIVEVDYKARTVVAYHPTCYGGTPNIVYAPFRLGAAAGGVTADAAQHQRAWVNALRQAGWFGISTRTTVTVVSIAHARVCAADGSGSPLPSALVMTEAMSDVRTVPPRYARRVDPATRRIPWSFECFLARTLDSPVHSGAQSTVSGLVMRNEPSRKHTWNLPFAEVCATAPPRDDVGDTAPWTVTVRVRNAAVPTLDAWIDYFAYVMDVGRRGGVPLNHPLELAMRGALATCFGQITGYAMPLSYGLDACVSGFGSTVHLVSGVRACTVQAQAGTLEWEPLTALLNTVQPQ